MAVASEEGLADDDYNPLSVNMPDMVLLEGELLNLVLKGPSRRD